MYWLGLPPIITVDSSVCVVAASSQGSDAFVISRQAAHTSSSDGVWRPIRRTTSSMSSLMSKMSGFFGFGCATP